MTRRLVLVGIFVLPVFNRGSIVQVVLGTIFCAIFLLLLPQAGPYLDRSNAFLANAASFSLLLFFVCCLLSPRATTRTALRLDCHV